MDTMDTKKQYYKSNRDIIIMGILSIFFSLMTGAPNLLALLFIGFVPLVCSILFLIIKHPALGIICTAFFFLNRIAVFTGKGTLPAIIIIVALTGYFAYTTYLSGKDWKVRRENMGKK